MREPGRGYFPEEWDDPYIVPDKLIALNADKIGKATPYSISPQVAEFTKKFSENAKMPSDDVILSIHDDSWYDYYMSGNSYFIPENRWTHEVQRGPVHIKDNLYAIYLDADIYIKDYPRKYQYNGKVVEAIAYTFISRTLYRYIKDRPEQLDFVNYDDLVNDEWCAATYKWILRWLPKNKCRLTFYSTPEIEKALHCKVDRFVVECNEEISNVEIPVYFKSDLKLSMPYIKHDSLIMYMEVEEIE